MRTENEHIRYSERLPGAALTLASGSERSLPSVGLLPVILTFLLTIALACSAASQLRAGFNAEEYKECLRMASHFKISDLDPKYFCEAPLTYRRIYVSPVVGFDNAWELWQSPDGKIVAVSMRATVITQLSWFANFHAGMVRANGKIHLGEDIEYNLSSDTLACVHVGWVGGLLSLAPDIRHKLDSCYEAGVRDCILTGHSQGGALCYLLTAYLRLLQRSGDFHADMTLKTYCSAAPKPGDYAFALSYERLTRGGWAFNVVNSDDWVPETPLSAQTPTDFRPTNPFTRVDDMTSAAGMKGMDKLKVKILFRKLGKPSGRYRNAITKYLGYRIGDILSDMCHAYTTPRLANLANYQRCGDHIVMQPTENYHRKHPRVAEDFFEHHMYRSYMDLANEEL